MNWRILKEEGQLTQIAEESKEKLVLVFKNSTRCSTSALALNRLSRDWKEEKMKNCLPYYLDVIMNRGISMLLENTYGVIHHSPQVLVIKNGRCIYDQSHLGINYPEIEKLNDEISV